MKTKPLPPKRKTKKSDRQTRSKGAASSSAFSPTWLQAQIDYRQKEFDAKAKELVWVLTQGGGSQNLHVLDMLRTLEWNYLACAAYKMAASDEKPTLPVRHHRGCNRHG